MMERDVDCQKRIKLLEEENEQLRRAATEFGRLAERLNAELRDERRRAQDRRSMARTSTDRRAPTDASNLES